MTSGGKRPRSSMTPTLVLDPAVCMAERECMCVRESEWELECEKE